jgi:hypothetical protein
MATFVEPNLAIHYIALASLAYDLITRNLDPAVAPEIEEFVRKTRASYSATKFYRVFGDGGWIEGLELPAGLASRSVRKALKQKWLDEADLTRSYDSSNIVFMRLQLIASELTGADIDGLLDLPTKDSRGNDQAAGLDEFLDFIKQRQPEKLSDRVRAHLEASERDEDAGKD